MYSSVKKKLFQNFSPFENSSHTLVLFSRLIGIGIIFTSLQFHLQENILIIFLDFFMQGLSACILYLLAIYVIDSIALYDFEFQNEIILRKNFSYALISSSNSLSIAYIMKIIFSLSEGSLVILLFLWLFVMMTLGFCSKSFVFLSRLPFNRFIAQKNIAIAPAYMGFIFGWTVLVSTAFDRKIQDIKWYSIHVILTCILILIILPFFHRGILFLFQIKNKKIEKEVFFYEQDSEVAGHHQKILGYAFFEGCLFATICLLTTVVITSIDFEIFTHYSIDQ